MTAIDRAAPPSPNPSTAGEPDLVSTLAPLLARAAARGRRTLVAATVPLSWRDPVALFSAARTIGEEPALWLQPGEGFGLLAIGSAWSVRAAGPNRFRTAATAWEELVDDALVRNPGVVRGTGPLLLGGFGFAAEPARSPTWRGFEAASLVLPRLLVTLTPGTSWLTASVVVAPTGFASGDVECAADELAQIWKVLAARVADPVPFIPATAGLKIVAEVPTAPEWQATVRRLGGAIGEGRVDKVVLARRVDLINDEPIDIPAVLRRLEAAAPESTVFAISAGSRTLLGATPERLVRTEGREFRTVAMAGSIGCGRDRDGDDRLAAELLTSEKDRQEHGIVVKMLRTTLVPVAERLEFAPRPTVVRLRHVQHLATEVSGLLREQTGIVAVVERLHPTPAVGGAPRGQALELIAGNEPFERGWYAGPVGWFDRRGDGEFVVALRSGIVDGREASLFAGCGIVASSDPGREWEESLIKLRALASALGTLEQ